MAKLLRPGHVYLFAHKDRIHSVTHDPKSNLWAIHPDLFPTPVLYTEEALVDMVVKHFGAVIKEPLMFRSVYAPHDKATGVIDSILD